MTSKKRDIRDGFFETLLKHYKKNKKVVLITADQGAFLLNEFKNFDDKRCLFFNISEQHMVSFASGLAMSGYDVYIYAISPFLIFKTVEQIKVDLDLNPNINLTLIGSGTGLCYSADGPTHHSLEDIAVMSPFKNISIFTPSNYIDALNISLFISKHGGLNYVRLDKGDFYDNNKIITLNKNQNIIELNSKQANKCIISYGITINYLLTKSLENLKNFTLINFIKLNPISDSTLNKLKNYNHILVIEESLSSVSLASLLKVKLYNSNIKVDEISIQNNNNFEYGSRDYLFQKLLLNKNNLKTLKKFIEG